MITFKALANIGMFEKVPLGAGYANEQGTSGSRQDVFIALEKNLKTAIARAKRFQSNSKTPQAAEEQVYNPAPARGKSMRTMQPWIERLANFHQQEQERSSGRKQEELNKAAIRVRSWLMRQGAVIKGESDINFPQSMKLKVYYDHSPELQKATKIKMDGGILKTNDLMPLDTSKMVTAKSGPGWGIYVMSASGNLHVHSHSVGHYHHSSLLAGAAVAGAGELEVKNGKILTLSNKSGHYCPPLSAFLQVLGRLQAKKISLDFKIQFWEGQKMVPDKYDSVTSFMASIKKDDASVGQMAKDMATIVNAGHRIAPYPVAGYEEVAAAVASYGYHCDYGEAAGYIGS